MPDRRSFRWVDELLDIQVAPGAQANRTLLSNTTVEERVGWTLTRMVFCYSLKAINSGIVDGHQKVDMGIGITSQEAFAAGALPDPEVPSDYPFGGWLYRCRHMVDDNVANGVPAQVFERDLRAQRKLGRGEAYIILVNQTDIGAGFSIVLLGSIRSLYRV